MTHDPLIRPAAQAAYRAAVRRVGVRSQEDPHRLVPEEVAVALVHDASTTAVMMATPADLEDFAVGFSLTEAVMLTLRKFAAWRSSPPRLGWRRGYGSRGRDPGP